MRQSSFIAEDWTAEFSRCGLYRYRLSRRWGPGRHLTFVMLNPSTADQFKNDPTVSRCMKRAKALGSGGVEVVNLFAFRATNPRDMIDSAEAGIDIVGPLNDEAILDACKGAAMVVCAWGTHGSLYSRAAFVKQGLLASRTPLHVLTINLDGSPKHPLYVADSVSPRPW